MTNDIQVSPYSKNLGKYPLSPIVSNWMREVMGHVALVEELTQKYGSPINLHHLPSFKKNIQNYQEVFSEYGLEGQIYFARKANKSKALVKAALEAGIGVDTASQKELEEAVALGGGHENLVLTAAVKTPRMVRFAIMNKVPIIIDNLDELRLVQENAKNLQRNTPIGLRLSGFRIGEDKLYSRFGFDIEKDRETLKKWFSTTASFPNLQLQGLHFHLDGYSIAQRGEAVLQSLSFIKELEEAGRKIGFLDIGGGILMNYLQSKDEWQTFGTRLQQAVLKEKEPITFANNGLGFEQSQIANGIDGKLQTYPYYNEINGANFLRGVLDYAKGSSLSVAESIRRMKLQIRIEPGRSLMDQVGMTVAKVAHRKQDAKGDWLVGLEMNMSQLKSSSADYLVDPFIIYKKEVAQSEKIDLYLTGAYCLEQDVILKRQLTYPKLPEVGDFVVFINTGGYMMHFYETEAHLFELSTNLYMEDPTPFKISDIIPDNAILRQTEEIS